MQSSLLDLTSPVSTLNNIAEKTYKKLNSIGISRVIDLLFYFPINVVFRNFCKNINELKIKQHCVIKLRVIGYQKSPKTTRVICQDIDGNMVVINFFKIYKGYLENYLPINSDVIILGIAEIYQGVISFNHPDKILKDYMWNKIKSVESVYTQHHELTSYKFRSFIEQAIIILNQSEIPEWLDEKIIKEYQFPSFKEAINNIHNPKSLADIQENSQNKLRLAFDELLSYHLSLMQVRSKTLEKKGLPYIITEEKTTQLYNNLTFKLTNDQIKAIENIKKEFLKEQTSTILLQGDVGSGKTIVCFIAALFAIESSYQVAFMAPTEILAYQHYKNFLLYASNLGISISLLKGKEKIKIKKTILEDIKENKTHITIGTHALFQEAVQFNNLGLVIIDEQHRFGVEQRLQLLNKGNNPNLILTTATPIPRTLALSLYGDISYYDIKEKPSNRKPIITKVISKNKLKELTEGLKRTILKKEKVFWVCPLIENSEKLKLSSSVERYDYLSKELLEFTINSQIYLIHGKMSAEEKEKALHLFKNHNEGVILVATTVIEVGIDIPECNIMIIEDADRFGLAQLHQLRGRVGRGEAQGICILLYSEEISLTGKKRLSIIKNSNDGFYIAEKDLEIRGYGDILGTNQSGGRFFKIVNLDEHSKLMTPSMHYAKLLFHKMIENDDSYIKNISYCLKIFDKYIDKQYIKSG